MTDFCGSARRQEDGQFERTERAQITQPLTADGSGASQASLLGAQAAARQEVLHVLMLLLLARLRLRCHGDGGGAVLLRHGP